MPCWITWLIQDALQVQPSLHSNKPGRSLKSKSFVNRIALFIRQRFSLWRRTLFAVPPWLNGKMTTLWSYLFVIRVSCFCFLMRQNPTWAIEGSAAWITTFSRGRILNRDLTFIVISNPCCSQTLPFPYLLFETRRVISHFSNLVMRRHPQAYSLIDPCTMRIRLGTIVEPTPAGAERLTLAGVNR